MSKEILLVVDAVSNEKGVGKDVIFGALEAALASAARKLSDDERDVRVAIDRGTGEYETFRRWEVIGDDEEMENEDAQLLLADALKIDPEVEVGGFIDKDGQPKNVGKALMVDAIATTISGLSGTSSGTTYIESASGVEEGGRTGLTAVVTGILFLPFMMA